MTVKKYKCSLPKVTSIQQKMDKVLTIALGKIRSLPLIGKETPLSMVAGVRKKRVNHFVQSMREHKKVL